MNTKLAITPSVKALGEGRYRFKLSDDSVDRDGDTINPRGWQLEAYQRNPVDLWAHKHDVPAIGRCPYMPLRAMRWWVTFNFRRPAAMGLRMKSGAWSGGPCPQLVRGVPPPAGHEERHGHDHHEQELIEWSGPTS
jgi:hypothetical protein